MLNKENVRLGQVRSGIRELFEYGKKRKAEIGEENVFDFSIGNPSVPPPESVREALSDLVKNSDPVALHGYTSAQGDFSVREAVANDLNRRFNAGLNADFIYMTCGASASLTITLNALLNVGDEVIVFSPFFPEYKVFCEHAGGKLVVVPSDKNFQPDLKKFSSALNARTKAVIINSPNNPSGVVYGEEVIKELCKVLAEHEKKTGNRVFIISDEPYRELVFGGIYVPFIMNYYADSIVCYSFSKSLSLPGERIGYLAIPNEAEDSENLLVACGIATRILGFVNAPSLQQLVIEQCIDEKTDVSAYDKNRRLLYNALTEYGFECIRPQGAFYLFVKSPIEEDKFVAKAKEYNILLVGGKSFACEGYVRIAYCVSYDMIERSLPYFKKLAEETVK